jgi:hypothetical protein
MVRSVESIGKKEEKKMVGKWVLERYEKIDEEMMVKVDNEEEEERNIK